jgi:hypothetical protein
MPPEFIHSSDFFIVKFIGYQIKGSALVMQFVRQEKTGK